MKQLKIIILCVLTLLVCSCDDKGVSFGTVEYYPSFLWSKEKISPVTKEFYFDFSQDAKMDKAVFAEFQFVDNDGKPIPTDVMQVSVNGQKLEENRLRVNSGVSKEKIEFSFSPNAPEGKHQGYLKLVNHNLDRLDSQVLSPGKTVEVFQWTLVYDKQMNPLAKRFCWVFIIIVLLLFLWFFVLRSNIYPRFGKFKKSVIIRKDGVIAAQLNVSFKGARQVVFFNKRVAQPYLNRIFCGEIKTIVSPLFEEKLTFVPKRKNAAAFGNGYVINPNPMPRNGIATICNQLLNIEITIR